MKNLETTSNTVTWLPGLLLAPFLRFISPEGLGITSASASASASAPASTPRRGLWVTASFLFVYSLALFWLNLVTKNVPEPYLDEIFHIPQAQTYCIGQYDHWDPKLTTPPGLYIFATLFVKLRWATWHVLDLRLLNAVTLPVAMLYALSCRHLITSPPRRFKSISTDSIHTALNIVLFPPIFFFSGLFYTDLLSTCVVLATYRLFLHRTGVGSWIIYPAGLLSLMMRQTNIFWVAIFLGGLEAVRTLKSVTIEGVGEQVVPGGWKERTLFEFERWSKGEIHDVPLSEAGVHDFIICAISITVGILHQPFRILARLWPYIALLVSFAGFVYWNGGVVLGDKSNHVATIHLPQLVYLFVFIAFFSLPLLIPPTLVFLESLLSLFRLPLFPRLVWKYTLVTTYCTGALGVTLLIIKYNTIIHPFTLADNRHYVFYAFRYTILRHPLIRYLLAPVYLACGWAVYLTLCSPLPLSSKLLPLNSSNTQQKLPPFSSRHKPEVASKAAQKVKDVGRTTSFLLVFFLATALSLITAPLVEPRYFIIPWVIWRLHVPSLTSLPPSTSQHEQKSEQNRTNLGAKSLDNIEYWTYRTHDCRLWFETLWFLGINIVTGYIFLYRGFSWPQEPGKVQRFMW